jgi:hypothetical protein
MKLLKEEWKDQIKAYGQMETNARMRQMAGLVFESMGQLQLQKEVALCLVPMTRQLGRGNPKWTMTQLNDNDRAGSSSTALNVGNTSTVTSINLKFTPDRMSVYKGAMPSNISPNILYVPKAWNQVAIDSFILTNGVLCMFQFTIASSHPIKPGIMKLLSDETLKKAQWRLIFVVPPDRTLEFPDGTFEFSESPGSSKMKEFWRKVTLFTAEFDPDKHTSPAVETAPTQPSA